MNGQFIIVHKATGEIMQGKQGIYTTRKSANRALSYWIKKDNHSEYSVIHLDQKLLMTLV